jgi:hypothetical protein
MLDLCKFLCYYQVFIVAWLDGIFSNEEYSKRQAESGYRKSGKLPLENIYICFVFYIIFVVVMTLVSGNIKSTF